MNYDQKRIMGAVNSHFSKIDGSVVFSTENPLTYVPLHSVTKRWRWLISRAARRGLPGAFVAHVNYRTFLVALSSFKPCEDAGFVETGSSAYGTNSTKLLSEVASIVGCGFDTIDTDSIAAENAKWLLSERDHSAHCCDSAEFLERTNNRYCFVYLDSFDLNQDQYREAAEHGLREFLALQGKLTPGAVILIDDTPRSPEIFRSIGGKEQGRASSEWLNETGSMPGKGALVVDWVRQNKSYEILDWDYQVVIRYTG